MSTGTQGGQPPPAQSSKMLLDSPAPEPALGFGPIAEAFASIIEASEPRFAIGIFGDWGSGKTTLMNTIERKLDPDTAIPVRFNAWRYEREPELLVPLLDTIRQSLVDWAAARPRGARRKKARMAARRIGRVVRALTAGVSVQVGLVPGAKLTYDAVKAVDQLRDSGSAEDQPQSLYFGGFTKLSEAVEEFRRGDITRIVVFVDDLDRCLPSTAIQVLEAMKLFFDLPGFVFVVGLDQRIIERAVASRFGSISPATTDTGVPSVGYSRDSQIRIAGEYLKKLFQVPYSLQPVILPQLSELLEAMYTEAELKSPQVDDLRSRVQPYLQYVAGDERVNPREIKRFINTYTLQRLVRPDKELDPNVVLALQTIAFHPDWQAAYDTIVTDWASFREGLERYRTGDGDGLGSVWPKGNAVPSDFLRYARSRLASPLVEAGDLEPYLSSLQTTGSTPWYWIQPAYRAVGELRRILGQFQRPGRGDQLASEINRQLSDLMSGLPTPAGVEDPQLPPVLGSIRTVAAEIATIEKTEENPDRVAALASELGSNLTQLEQELRFLRRRWVESSWGPE